VQDNRYVYIAYLSKLALLAANNELSEVCGIIKPGQRGKINGHMQ